MSFPKYLKYKASGVEWLGEVPEGWGLVQFKQFVEIQNGSDHKHIEQSEGYPVFGSGGAFAYASEFLYDGESVLLGRKGTIDKPLYVTGRFWTVDTMYWTKIRANTSGRYVYYLAVTIPFDYYSTNTALPSMTKGALNRHCVTHPPLDEQVAIATFLDRETAKIDELVAEQRRLMELLKEKRQAVISHAVTKGLNPNAKMKPSGIEWLGDVPEHWEVLKGALIGTLFGSEQVPEDAVLDEGDLPFIKVGSLSRDSFEIESWDYFVDRSIAANYRPRSGFIVFPKRGAAIFTNKVNIVDRPSLIDPNLMGWQIGERAVPAFIAYALKCRKLDELADVSTVPQINNKHIAPERFAVPPIEEQQKIVGYLDAESAKFDTLTAEAQRSIDLLQERRTALISAAVTGQIDVRKINNSQGV